MQLIRDAPEPTIPDKHREIYGALIFLHVYLISFKLSPAFIQIYQVRENPNL